MINSIIKLLTWSFFLVVIVIMALPILIDTQMIKYRDSKDG